MSISPTARPATLLLTFGADRDDQIRARDAQVTVAGSSDLFELIDADYPHHRLQITRQFLRHNRRPDLTRYHVILNLITEPEHNDRVLDNLRRLLRGFPGKVINRPEVILRTTRDQVAKRLADVPGLLVPKAIRLKLADPAKLRDRLDRAGMKFPLILRQPGTHLGTSQARFDDLEAMIAAMVPGTEYIATQFVDYRSADGLYRKCRTWFIGPHCIFRHQFASDHWNVHNKDGIRFMVDRPDLMEEEKALFASPDGAFPAPVKQVLAAIRQRIGLDYFGIDFGLMPDGQVILFEANATMNFFSTLPSDEFAYVRACVPPARAAFRELLGLPPAT
jgi:glutathione synthase/RimK-type ligase-like ATP-grasp enzyme